MCIRDRFIDSSKSEQLVTTQCEVTSSENSKTRTEKCHKNGGILTDKDHQSQSYISLPASSKKLEGSKNKPGDAFDKSGNQIKTINPSEG